MNTEELKLILDTIKGITDGASTVALWWMALHYVLGFLTPVLLASIAGYTVVRIALVIANGGEWSSLARQVAAAWGSKDPGTMCVYTKDREAIQKAIVAGGKQ